MNLITQFTSAQKDEYLKNKNRGHVITKFAGSY